MRWLYALALMSLLGTSASCTFDGSNRLAPGDSGLDSDGPARFDDGALDTTDGPAGCQNFASHFDACSVAPTSGVLVLNMDGDYFYDTDDDMLFDPLKQPVAHASDIFTAAEGKFRAIVTDQFLLGSGSRLRATGSMPLAIASFGTLDVQGRLDLGDGGAGARAQTCDVSMGSQGGDANGGGGGGGGGGYRGAGGNGGVGNGDGSPQGAVGSGGAVASVPASPLGGCPGGKGGDGDDTGGAAGAGGGAIYLSSATVISVSGGIQAGGGGGIGGENVGSGFGDAGGGGGGSGGYIFLEAPMVEVSGVIAANGGGGGEGSGNNAGGNPGQPGAMNDLAANGGANGSPTGSNGGAGSASSTLGGVTVTASEAGAGGGGGGAAGYIRVSPSQTLGGTISPAAL